MLIQITVDTNALDDERAPQERKSLESAAMWLMHLADVKDPVPQACTGANCGSVDPTVHSAECVAEHERVVDAAVNAQPDMLPASVLFGKPGPNPSNILPFPGAPSLPAVNTAALPVLPAIAVPAADVSTAASATNAGTPVAEVSLDTATKTGIASGVVELDKAGLPWDARIHQSNRNQKADGTWMLKRGLDKDLAATVLAELTAAKLANLPPAAPAAGPVTLPPVQLPAATVGPTTGGTILGTLPPPPVGLPLPPVSVGLPAISPAVDATPVALFRAMMAKIGPALAAKTVTQEQVAQAHQALGLPQLQLAITKPELIPLIEAALGL